jgi:hypothetical protein
MSSAMRCFESLLINIENDRHGNFRPETIARKNIQTHILQHEPRATSAAPKNASFVYRHENNCETHIRNEIAFEFPVTLNLIEKAVNEAARTKDAVIHLGRLRRQLAWGLHPDRHINYGTTALLAEANACIDRALAQLKF